MRMRIAVHSVVLGLTLILTSSLGLAQRLRLPPGVESGDELTSWGLLDVTRKPYLADPTGTRDSTEAIRKAVNDARDFGLVAFFPVGTYLISDTISCEQENYKLETPRAVDGSIANYWHKNHRINLLGSKRGGKRPVLKLSRDAGGFDDPANPKVAVWIWARTWFGDGTGEQPNISFGHYFIGIDIDVSGHPGAIGLKHSGSQGCTLQDANIFAEGAFAGLYNCPGQAAGTYNVEVVGGDYGFYADSKSRFPILVGCRFRNQTKAAIRYTGGGNQVPTLVIAAEIENSSGKVVDLTTEPAYAGISLIDCVIRMKGGVVVDASKPENVFLENTYVIGADRIAPGGGQSPSPGQWTIVERYSSHSEGATTLVNGVESPAGFAVWKPADRAPDTAAIRNRHLRPKPSFEDPGVLNVRDFGARGDGTSDDTPAFERAIKAGDKVFVPPGDYRCAGELRLRPDTQLFSLSAFLTSIGSALQRRESIDGQGNDSFTLSTPDDPAASPGLWFISVGGRLAWRSGNGYAMHARGRYRFEGNAGGRLHAIIAMGEQFQIDGVHEPLAFYSLNVERVTRNPQSLIRNSRNVRLYYFKVEAGTRNLGETGGGDENIPGFIENSEDIRIYCMYGNVKGLSRDRPMLEIVDSKNIQVSQLKAFFPDVFPHLRETIGGASREVPSSKICAFYRRD